MNNNSITKLEKNLNTRLELVNNTVSYSSLHRDRTEGWIALCTAYDHSTERCSNQKFSSLYSRGVVELRRAFSLGVSAALTSHTLKL